MPSADHSRLCLLGNVRVERGNVAAALFPPRARRPRLALAVLATSRDRPVARDAIAEVIWPGGLPDTWEAALRNVVAQVRAAITVASLGRGTALHQEFGGYRLSLADGVVIDVDEATTNLTEAARLLAIGRPADALVVARTATSALSQTFLAGEDDEWVRYQRMSLRAARLRGLLLGAEASLAVGAAAEALAAAEEVSVLDPFDEQAWRLVMDAHAAAGNRALAFQAYEACRRLLASELGVGPSAATEAAYASLLDVVADPPTIASRPERRDKQARHKSSDVDLLGRTRELALLEAAALDARRGRCRVTIVLGEPGIGKTRLLREASDIAARNGFAILKGRCSADLATPYLPIVQALTEEARCRDASALRLGRRPGELVQLLPELGERFDGEGSEGIDAATRQWRLFDAIASWLEDVAADSGAVLVVDDLQWADAATLALIHHLMSIELSGSSAGWVIAATCRSADVPIGSRVERLIAEVARSGRGELIDLGPLDVVETRALATAASTSTPAIGLEEAVALSGGNPLFVIELARHQLPFRPQGDVVVPAAVESLIKARVGQLAAPTQHMLPLAAVIGRECPLGLLAEVSHLSADGLLDALEEAMKHGLLVEADDDTWTFAHDVVRETLVAGTSRSRRSLLHARIAEVIERHHPDDAERLAHHYEMVPGEAALAAKFHVLAADNALARTAYAGAADHFGRALALAQSSAGSSDAELNEIRFRLGCAQRDAGDPQHRDALLLATELALRSGDASLAANAALANTRFFARVEVDADRIRLLESVISAIGKDGPAEQRARLLATLAGQLSFSPQRERRLELARSAVLSAESADDETFVDVSIAAASALRDPTTLDERLALIGDVVERARNLKDPRRFCQASFWLCTYSLDAADIVTARSAVDDGAKAADQLAHPMLQWIAVSYGASLDLLAGDIDRAAGLVSTLAATVEIAVPDPTVWAGGLRMALAYETNTLDSLLGELKEVAGSTPCMAFDTLVGFACAELGLLDEASEILHAHMDRNLERIELNRAWLMCMTRLGEIAVRVGDADAATRLYRELRPFANQAIDFSTANWGSVERHLAVLAAVAGDKSAAEVHFNRAIAAHERMGAPLWRDRTVSERNAHLGE